MQYSFLTNEWIVAVDCLRNELPPIEEPPEAQDLSVNFHVHDFPGGPRTVHLDGSSGLIPDQLEDASTTVSLTYEAARTLFLEGDFAKTLEAFMVGDIDIEGELSSLIGLQNSLGSLTPNQREFHAAIVRITATDG